MTPRTHQPYSAWSALLYPTAAVVPFWAAGASMEAAVLAAAMIFLGVATFLFHHRLSGASRELDHAAMNAATAALATHAAGGSWAWMLLAAAGAAVVLEFVMRVPNRHIVGVFVWVAVVGGATGLTGWLVAGVILLALGFAAWTRAEREEVAPEADLWHAGWHALTALGLAFLFVAAA